MRGLEKVRAEFSLTALAYNLQAGAEYRWVHRADGRSGGLKGFCLGGFAGLTGLRAKRHNVEPGFSRNCLHGAPKSRHARLAANRGRINARLRFRTLWKRFAAMRTEALRNPVRSAQRLCVILDWTERRSMMAEAKLAPNLPQWMIDHTNRYISSGGTDGHMYDANPPGYSPMTVPSLLLTTTGRKSGEKFIFPLYYGQTGEQLYHRGIKRRRA